MPSRSAAFGERSTRFTVLPAMCSSLTTVLLPEPAGPAPGPAAKASPAALKTAARTTKRGVSMDISFVWTGYA